MSKKQQAFYASPGADDRFLRPATGQSFAPRQIAVCDTGNELWTAWIHYRKAKDSIVVCRKTPENNGRLVTVSGEYEEHFSLPVLLDTGDKVPEIFYASKEGGKYSIKHCVCENGKWRREKFLTTCCEAIYYIDAAVASGGIVHLVYAGVSKKYPGIQVFSRIRKGKRWLPEQIQPVSRNASVNRPKLAVDGRGDVYLAADVYEKKQYRICSRNLSQNSRWQLVSALDGWNLFPSIIADASGGLWISWLHQTPVRREDVMGMHQEAYVARRTDDGSWETVGGGPAVNLNLGLLPIKRYFGYDGLRRYPRMAAMDSGKVWLCWEQQKDEEEIWGNVENGDFIAMELDGQNWRKPKLLVDFGSCHAFDTKTIHKNRSLRVAVKHDSDKAGNGFVCVHPELAPAKPYRVKPPATWKDWRQFPLPVKRNSPRPLSRSGMKLFWGDLHCHSVYSPDAEGEVDELYHFASDWAGLDFVCLIDNDFYPFKALLDSECAYTKTVAGKLTDENKFRAWYGFEWTYHRDKPERPFNHRNIVFTGNENRIRRRCEKDGCTEEAFAKNMAKAEALVFPHHAYWKLLGLPNEYCIEASSAWGTYILDADTVKQALNAGKKFGFEGSSDSHRFMPGLSGALTGIYAEDLSEQALVAAFKARRCFATTGNRTGVVFKVNGALMGSEITTDSAPKLEWQVSPEGKLEKVEIIRNGEIIHTANKTSGTFTDNSLPDGDNWYYLQVKEAGEYKRYPHNVAAAFGKWAWSSPVWVLKS